MDPWTLRSKWDVVLSCRRTFTGRYYQVSQVPSGFAIQCKSFQDTKAATTHLIAVFHIWWFKDIKWSDLTEFLSEFHHQNFWVSVNKILLFKFIFIKAKFNMKNRVLSIFMFCKMYISKVKDILVKLFNKIFEWQICFKIE